MIQITYDPRADALDIQLKDRPIARTKVVSESVNIDFDAAGEVVGIEILYVRQTGIDPSQVELIELNETSTLTVTAPDGSKVRFGPHQETAPAQQIPAHLDNGKPRDS